MSSGYSRREWIGLVGSGVVLPTLVGRSGVSAAALGTPPEPAKEAMRGAFMILATPFTETKAVDYEDLASQVDWLGRCGVQGMVWPQNASEYSNLTRDEIMRGIEVVAKAHKGKKAPLVLGVQQDDTKGMLELAAFALKFKPDATIAMPPTGARSLEDYRQYYSELAKLTDRPIFIQTVPGTPKLELTVETIVELARQHPQLGYVKEEHQPVFKRMAELARHRPSPIRRVFGGIRGRAWPYEMRQGYDGTMNGGSMYAEIYARLWNLHLQKSWDEVRDLHGKLLLMLQVENEIPGAARYLLKKRGIFKTTVSRQRDYSLSPTDIAHIDHMWSALKPYLVKGRETSAS